MPNSKRYDLEDRTFAFAKRVIAFIRNLPKTIANIEVMKQLVRASGSVGANYIEANGAVSRNDFKYRIKICRKEAKESRYSLRLLELRDAEQEEKRQALVQEATELMKIFGSILQKSKLFQHLNFEFRYCFGFRYSNFEFISPCHHQRLN